MHTSIKRLNYVSLAGSLVLLFGWSSFAQSPTLAGVITTYAGSDWVDIGATGSIIPDGAGGLYFTSSESTPKPHSLVYRRAANGTLSVVAGSGPNGFSGDGGPATAAQLNAPFGLAIDSTGNLFIADGLNHRIRKVTPAGVISTVAGNGIVGLSGDGGPATSAQLVGPAGIAIDTGGNLFIVDGARVRKVIPAGIISTVAGTGLTGFSGDGGPATAAKLFNPDGITVDLTGNLFIAEFLNMPPAGARVRKVTPDGIISTVVGTGTAGFSGDGGLATLAQLNGPASVSVDAAGNLFIADQLNARIRKVTYGGIISTVAGTGTNGLTGDGGSATAAQLYGPGGVAVDAAGTVFIADSIGIRKVTPARIIFTIVGSGFSGDGDLATNAELNSPSGINVDPSGNVYIADIQNRRIRKVTPAGIISTVAGTGIAGSWGDGGPAIAAQLGFPVTVASDIAGNLFIADLAGGWVRKVTPAGVITTVAGNGTFGFSGDGGPATAAALNNPNGLAVDTSGNVFIADTFNSRVRKVTPAGIISTVAGTGVAGFSGDGGPATAAEINAPTSLAIDSIGNLFIADRSNQRIRKVTPAGIISTVTGTGTAGFSGDGGLATSAQLNGPHSISVDVAGNLFIADQLNARIRKVTAAGIISTVAGSGAGGRTGDSGPALVAQLNAGAIAVDAAGNLFIADGINRVRKVTFTEEAFFSIADRGGVSLQSSGTLPTTIVGYASVKPTGSSTTPGGLAIFGYRSNNTLVSEAGVPASPLIQSGRIYAEINAPVNTGLAIANPNPEPAVVSFFFTDSTGNFGSGSITVAANGQIAKFLNEPPFNAPSSLSGTLTFNSSIPVAVVALRGLTNERSEFLITTLPVADLRASTQTGTIVFPNFADGGGWTTQIVLVNSTDSVLNGSIQFVDQSGQPASVTVNGLSSTNFTYSLIARTSQTFQTSDIDAATVSGSVRVIPAMNTTAPSGLAVFSFHNSDGITVSEAGVPAVPVGSAFRLYAEGAPSIQTGFAVMNTSANDATITLELTKLDGSSMGLTGILTVRANGQSAVFLNQVQGLGSLPATFQGVVRLLSSSAISVIGLRGHYNERNDFLITTIPPVNEASPASNSPVFFPHIADSGGYTTQFILLGTRPSSGTIDFLSQSGTTWNATFQ
jgi:sugar lactone lactonase YvrE